MEKLAVFIKILIFLHCSIVLVNCSCILNFPKNPRNIPSYKKRFGTKFLKIPFTEDNVLIHEFGNTTGYCATTFNDFTYNVKGSYNYNYGGYRDDTKQTVTGEQTVSLYCQNGQIHYKNGYQLVETTLSCADIDWKIYESATSMPWCETNVGSYILASNYAKDNHILAGACFDIEKVKLRNCYYSVNSKSSSETYNDLQIIVPNGLNSTEIGVEVPHFNSILSQLSGKGTSYDEEQVKDQQNYWLKLANYQVQSIVQAGPFMDYFAKYEEMLKIIWWPGLLNGNWKRFTNALEDHLNNVTYSYEVFAGTSGILETPPEGKCMQKEILELKVGNKNKTIPAYIWNYFKASDDSEQFVIVGYNAPFYDFFPVNEIIFCNDICDQITWLNEIRPSFRYSAMGEMFCCSVEDVSNYLDGFPVNLEPTKELQIEMVETSTFIVEETQTENENIDNDWM